jgi:hypothetical protein
MQDLEAVIAGSSTLENVHIKSLAHCIEVCLQCATSCTACADECLDEPELAEMRRCIRLNVDCADIVSTIARLLSRRGEPDLAALRACLEAGTSIANACAAETLKHAGTYEYCRLTGEICVVCARECEEALSMMCAVPSA